MKSTTLIALAICLPSGWISDVQADTSNCNSTQTIIKSVRLFDGVEIKSEATVIFQCKKILSILDATSKFKTLANAKIINGEGKTLMPGLIDAHVHIWNRKQLERTLDFGVTTVYDMGSSRELAMEMREEEKLGKNIDRADLRSAVLWVTAPGSHGTQFGEVPTLSKPQEAQDFVQHRIQDGADYIKVIYDNFKMFPRDIPTLTEETMIATIKAANQHAKKAVFHSRDLQAMTLAVNAGASGFVHIPVDQVPSKALINTLKEKGVFFTPNLSLARHEAVRILNDPHFGPMLTEGEIKNLKKWRSVRDENGDKIEYESLMKLHQAGVPILVGSDSPNGGTTAGATVHAELELLVEAGLKPIEALKSATSIPALVYGFTDKGRVATGMIADMILVEGKPDQNITDTRKIVTIWKSGVEQ